MQPLPPQKGCDREGGKGRERQRERERERERERGRGREGDGANKPRWAPCGHNGNWNAMRAARTPSASWLRLAKTDPSTCHEESQSASFEHSSHPPASFDRQDMLQRWLPLESAEIPHVLC